VQILTVALENLVRRKRNENVEIAPRAAALAGVAFAGQTNARAIVNTAWNADLQGAIFPNLTMAVTGAAGIGNNLAGAAATGAGPLYLKETLGRANAALTCTRCTGLH